MKTKLIKELQSADTLREVIEITDKYYNIDTPLPHFRKKILISKIPSIIDLLNLEKR